MDWFKTTSAFWSHPKVWGLKDRPFRVLVSSWGFAAQHGTGGRITRPALEQIKGKPADADALVEAGLWHPDGPDAWVIHDWDDHQSAAVKLEEKRARDRDRMRAVRSATVARQSRDSSATVQRLSRDPSNDSRGEIREEERREEQTPPLRTVSNRERARTHRAEWGIE